MPPVLALCGEGEGEGEPPRRADRSGLRASLAETWEHVQRSQPEQVLIAVCRHDDARRERVRP